MESVQYFDTDRVTERESDTQKPALIIIWNRWKKIITEQPGKSY